MSTMEEPTKTPTPNQQPPPSISVDEMIEQSISHVNCTQIIQAILVSIPVFFDSQQTFISVFAHAPPPWHCVTNSATCKTALKTNELCHLSKSQWTWDSPNTHTSIISEWDLQCANSFITGFPTTCYFVGCFLGGLALATLADSSLGRRNLLFLSSFLMSVAAFASAFSPNIWVYSGLRFLSGVGRAPIGVSALTLLTERVGRKWRSLITMIGFIHISLGILALVGIAYVIKSLSWRILYICTSVPGIVCCSLSYLFACESPRWLFMQGREKEAINVLKRIGTTTQFVQRVSPAIVPQQKQQTTNPFESFNILISKRWAIKRLIASVLLGFGIGLMYLGMFLGVGNLGFNVYLTLAFNSLLSIASYLLAFLFWIQRCNRRSSLLGFCTISGVASILITVIGNRQEGVVISLELVSLFCASMAYNIVLIYMVELFPTCVRNSSSSLVRQAMILGSVFDPMLVLIGRRHLIYSYGIFGLAMLLCGFLVICLPETKGKALCDTMEEQEFRDNNEPRVCFY